ncbi:MAG: phosphodiester glycosidase family protein [Chloroflexia bacterium]
MPPARRLVPTLVAEATVTVRVLPPTAVAQVVAPASSPTAGPRLIDTLPSALPVPSAVLPAPPAPPATPTALAKHTTHRMTATPVPRPTTLPTKPPTALPTKPPTALPTEPPTPLPTSMAAALLTAIAGVPIGVPSPIKVPPTEQAVVEGPPAAPPPSLGSAGSPMPLSPLIQDGALDGEGVWTPDGLPQPPDGGPPAIWKTFLRPDPARPDAQVYLVRFDPRRLRLHIVAGTKEPVPTDKVAGPGQVAARDLASLAAAFNGGWKSVNGGYGMMVNGRQVAPPNPRPDTATLAVHANGWIELAPWRRLSTATDLVSYRQNCPMLIDNGVITVRGHLTSTWGLSLLSQMYVWRSGIGQTADGSLIYAAGKPVSAEELAAGLEQAGAVTAMQLDINSAWVHWLSYVRGSAGAPHAEPLVSGMAYQRNLYLKPEDRDFFYLTWR